MNARKLFQRFVLARPFATFLVLGLALFVFGASSLNLVRLLSANLHLLADYGWQAIMDGALVQFFELLVTGYLGVASYVILKACEHRLSHWLSEEAS